MSTIYNRLVLPADTLAHRPAASSLPENAHYTDSATGLSYRTVRYTNGTAAWVAETGGPGVAASSVPAGSYVIDSGTSLRYRSDGSAWYVENLDPAPISDADQAKLDAFATAPLSDATPLVDSSAGAAGTGTAASRKDHVHPASLSAGDQAKLALITVEGTGAAAGLVLGTPGFSFTLPDPVEDGGTGYRLVVAGQPTDTNDQEATAIFGCDDPTYGNDGADFWSGTGRGVSAQATGAGGMGVYGAADASSAVGLYGSSHDGIAVRGATTGGTGVRGRATGATGTAGYFDATAGGLALRLEGPLRLLEQAAPSDNPPANTQYLWLDSTSHTFKAKTSDGTVREVG